MLPKPSEVWVIDFETTGLDMFKPDEEIKSMAVTYTKNNEMCSKFLDSKEDIHKCLRYLDKTQLPVLVYNAQFEMLCLMCKYPELNINIAVDGLRFVQQELPPREKAKGRREKGKKTEMNLKYATRYLLPKKYSNYEEPIKKWIIEHVVYLDETGNSKKPNNTNWGRFLTKAPRDLLEAYNIADTENTLRLYKTILDNWDKEGYLQPNMDYIVFDHQRYLKRCKRFVKAKVKGVNVLSDKLKESVAHIDTEMSNLKDSFYQQHKEDIDKATEIKFQLTLQKGRDACKSEVGKAKWTPDNKAHLKVPFNFGSTQQLTQLFVGIQRQIPKIFTTDLKTGRKTSTPSFNKKHLKQFKGTELLIKKSELNQASAQSNSLMQRIQYDGKWHIDVRAAGTVTGRTAGGGGLNIQALHRGYEPLAGCIVPEKDHVFIGSDIESAEPSVTAQLSGDPLVKYWAYEGEGKKPYYKNGIFFCDDPYVSFAAMTPMGRDTIKEVYDKGYNGVSLQEFWVNNAEPGKILFKKVRKMHKPWYLGMGYGMGATKLQAESEDAGAPITKEQAESIHEAYWSMIPYVKAFAERCADLRTKQGYINNPFGFHMRPEPHNSFNAVIQSSVNTIMDLYCEYIEDNGFPDAFRVLIHDEAIFEVHKDRIKEFMEVRQKAQDYVNSVLQWDFPMRFGAVIGTNFYEAKEGLSDEVLRERGIII